MKHHKYLIVGGGMTADSAVHGIRKIDQNGAIAMICEERHLPYDRPPFPSRCGRIRRMNPFGVTPMVSMSQYI